MSPLSVAQYLPADGRRFDLLVFDEASQIGTHDAIGAIARADQVIVVGDSKQLPPTTFFTRGEDTEALPDENDVLELLSRLVGKSLVVVDAEGAGECRYRLLEILQIRRIEQEVRSRLIRGSAVRGANRWTRKV